MIVVSSVYPIKYDLLSRTYLPEFSTGKTRWAPEPCHFSHLLRKSTCVAVGRRGKPTLISSGPGSSSNNQRGTDTQQWFCSASQYRCRVQHDARAAATPSATTQHGHVPARRHPALLPQQPPRPALEYLGRQWCC